MAATLLPDSLQLDFWMTLSRTLSSVLSIPATFYESDGVQHVLLTGDDYVRAWGLLADLRAMTDVPLMMLGNAGVRGDMPPTPVSPFGQESFATWASHLPNEDTNEEPPL